MYPHPWAAYYAYPYAYVAPRVLVGYAGSLSSGLARAPNSPMSPISGRPWAAVYVPPELRPANLERFCEMLTQDNEEWLREHPETPDLYRSGARYELQPEHWLSIPWALQMIQRGSGLDCKVLSAWRAAELRVRYGERRAQCGWTRYEMPDKIVYHVWVLRANGRKEDPSALLGMRTALPEDSSQERRPWILSPSM